MIKTNVIRSLQSFAIFPILTANLMVPSIGMTAKLPPAAVSVSVQNGTPLASVSDNQQKEHDEKVAKMKAYFADKKLPIAAGHAEVLVTVAEENGLDWTLLGGIEMIESTGCKFQRNNNCFGWNSAKTPFTSMEEGIRTVGENLGGNDPDTAKWYKDKTTEQILKIYNPPEIVKTYNAKVLGVMQAIKDYPVPGSSELALASS